MSTKETELYKGIAPDLFHPAYAEGYHGCWTGKENPYHPEKQVEHYAQWWYGYQEAIDDDSPYN